ncbi:hypothetical protein JTE90_017783 [Oedothorax gibbosus]|uniref:Uncharacterized protein n=1 Tax=Oedothorax gibbosus TaxID=931172 RepID=A0AAV6ULA8_9ARAC|nr:hypothetical protein JTE90_017783 [Oedothorax gibbosus]
MGQADECCPVITGCFFTLSGLALMVFGLMFLISGNLVGATLLAFGALCLSFGVFLVRTVCNVNFYSVVDTEEKEFENRGQEIMNMTILSSQGAPIGRIENWGMPQYKSDDREYRV